MDASFLHVVQELPERGRVSGCPVVTRLSGPSPPPLPYFLEYESTPHPISVKVSEGLDLPVEVPSTAEQSVQFEKDEASEFIVTDSIPDANVDLASLPSECCDSCTPPRQISSGPPPATAFSPDMFGESPLKAGDLSLNDSEESFLCSDCGFDADRFESSPAVLYPTIPTKDDPAIYLVGGFGSPVRSARSQPGCGPRRLDSGVAQVIPGRRSSVARLKSRRLEPGYFSPERHQNIQIFKDVQLDLGKSGAPASPSSFPGRFRSAPNSPGGNRASATDESPKGSPLIMRELDNQLRLNRRAGGRKGIKRSFSDIASAAPSGSVALSVNG